MAGCSTPNYYTIAAYTGFTQDSAASCGVLNLPDIIKWLNVSWIWQIVIKKK